MSRRLMGGVLGAGLLLALAGCGGPPSPPGVVTVRAATVRAATVFADGSTVAPCSVINPAAVHASVQSPNSLDDCVLDAPLGHGRTTVVIGPLLPPSRTRPGGRVRPLVGGMQLYREPDDQNDCADDIVFADQYQLMVIVVPEADSPTVNACPLIDTTARAVATRIAGGGIRHLTYPAGSVGPIDPCRLVRDSTLTAVGLTSPQTVDYPEHHQCGWASAGTDSSVSLDFTVGAPPSVLDPTFDRLTTVAGRQTVLSAGNPSTGYCTAQTGLNPYFGSEDVEIAVVTVELLTTENGAKACAKAVGIAATVWPQLPQASS